MTGVCGELTGARNRYGVDPPPFPVRHTGRTGWNHHLISAGPPHGRPARGPRPPSSPYAPPPPAAPPPAAPSSPAASSARPGHRDPEPLQTLPLRGEGDVLRGVGDVLLAGRAAAGLQRDGLLGPYASTVPGKAPPGRHRSTCHSGSGSPCRAPSRRAGPRPPPGPRRAARRRRRPRVPGPAARSRRAPVRPRRARSARRTASVRIRRTVRASVRASVRADTASARDRSTGAGGTPGRCSGRGGTAARVTWTNRVERSRRVRGTSTSIRCGAITGGVASKPYRASAASPVTIASP